MVGGAMWLRLPVLSALSGAAILCGCSGAIHPQPALTSSQLNLAQAEVQSSGGPPQPQYVSDEDATRVLHAAIGRIQPAADQLCREMAVGTCRWTFRAS